MAVEIFPRKLSIDCQAGEISTGTSAIVNASSTAATIAAINILGGNGVFSLSAPPGLPLALAAAASQALTINVDLSEARGEVEQPSAKLVVVDSTGLTTEADVIVNRVDDLGYRYAAGPEPNYPTEGMIWQESATKGWRYEDGVWVGITANGAAPNKFLATSNFTIDTQNDLAVITPDPIVAPPTGSITAIPVPSAGNLSTADSYNIGLVYRRRLNSGQWIYSEKASLINYSPIFSGEAVQITATGLTPIAGYEVGVWWKGALQPSGGVILASFQNLTASYSYTAARDNFDLTELAELSPPIPPGYYFPVSRLRSPKWLDLGAIADAATVAGIKFTGGSVDMAIDILDDGALFRLIAGLGITNAGFTDGIVGGYSIKELAKLAYSGTVEVLPGKGILTNTLTYPNLGISLNVSKNEGIIRGNASLWYSHVKLPNQSIDRRG